MQCKVFGGNMVYLPKNYLPKIKFNSRFIRAVDSDHENSINAQKWHDKKVMSKDELSKKYKGYLINTAYMIHHEDYKSNVEQVKNYCMYLQWLINHYLTDNQLSGLLHRFEGGSQSGWYVWLNEDLSMQVMLSEKMAKFMRFCKRLLLSPHLQFYKNNQSTHKPFIKTVRLNMIDKVNFCEWEVA